MIQCILRFFSQLTQKRGLQNIKTWVSNITDHIENSMRFKSGDAVGHIYLFQNLGKRRWYQSTVGMCSVLLEGERLFFKVFLHLFKFRNQNIVNVAIYVYLNILHENQRRLQRFRNCSLHHEEIRLLSEKTGLIRSIISTEDFV